jgi:hypothetical protein
MKTLYELLLKVGTNPQLRAWAMKQMINLKSLQSGYTTSYRHSKDLEKVKDILDPNWLIKQIKTEKSYNLKNKVLDIAKAKDKVKWNQIEREHLKDKFYGVTGQVQKHLKKFSDNVDDFFKKDAVETKWFNDTLKKYFKGDKKAIKEIDEHMAYIEKINREKVVPFWPRKKPYKVPKKAEGGSIDKALSGRSRDI